MAKKQLYGNKTEPCCETCTYGKLSADASVVLCRRGGVMPLYHSCRHYHYDPLKRVPRRQKPLDAFDAAAFSLSGLSDDEVAAKSSSSPEDSEMLSRLHAYLNDTSSPDAKTILDILAVEPKSEKAPEPASEPAPEVTASKTVTPNAPRATPETIPSPIIPDNSVDIFEDLKKLQINSSASSTKAAFNTFSLRLGDDLDEDEEEVPAAYNAAADILALSEDDLDDDSDEPLDADDLIFTNLGDPDEDEDVETLEINADGSVTATTKKLSDLMDS